MFKGMLALVASDWWHPGQPQAPIRVQVVGDAGYVVGDADQVVGHKQQSDHSSGSEEVTAVQRIS